MGRPPQGVSLQTAVKWVPVNCCHGKCCWRVTMGYQMKTRSSTSLNETKYLENQGMRH